MNIKLSRSCRRSTRWCRACEWFNLDGSSRCVCCRRRTPASGVGSKHLGLHESAIGEQVRWASQVPHGDEAIADAGLSNSITESLVLDERAINRSNQDLVACDGTVVRERLSPGNLHVASNYGDYRSVRNSWCLRSLHGR